MNDNLIYVKSFSAPEVDRREVLRYAGVRKSTAEIEDMLDRCILEAEAILNYNVCYRVFDIQICDGEVDLGFTKTESRSLMKTLDGCSKILVFCATVGSGIDRLVKKRSVTSPAMAVILQAFGSERVEALCDLFCSEIRKTAEEKGCSITGRFSPGYGDLPLELQRDVFATLDCAKRVGVSLGNNLFMTPTKSVTAILGIKNVN